MPPPPRDRGAGGGGANDGWKIRHLIIGVLFFVVGMKLGGMLEGSFTSPDVAANPKAKTNVIHLTEPGIVLTAPAHAMDAAATKAPLRSIRVQEKADHHKSIKREEEMPDDPTTAAPTRPSKPSEKKLVVEEKKEKEPQQDQEQEPETAAVAVRKADPDAPVETDEVGALNSIRGIHCPAYDAGIESLQIPLKHLPRKKKTSVGQKYDRRAHNCASNGIWNRVKQTDHHKILKHMAKLVGAERGDFVLDWGSGCGHSIEWLAKEYSTTAVGIDVSNKTIAYARANTTKKNMHCVADGTRLQWLPSDAFDRVISFGSIYHVYNRTLFCHVLRQLIRVTRVGGKVYNGWTENAEYKRAHVATCMDDLPVKVRIVEERTEFADVEIFPLKSQQTVPNTYSLILTKTAAIKEEDEERLFSLDEIPIICDTHRCEKRENWEDLPPARGEEKKVKKAAKKVKTAPPTTTEAELEPTTKAEEEPGSTKAEAEAEDENPPTKANLRKLARESKGKQKRAVKTVEEENAKRQGHRGRRVMQVEQNAESVAEKPSEEAEAKEAEPKVNNDVENNVKKEDDDNHHGGSGGAKEEKAAAAYQWPFTCPPYDKTMDERLQIPLKHLPRGKKTSVAQKYDRRAHNCATEGIWHKVTFEDHVAILRTAAKLTGFTPKSTVFDWGCGCGHKLAYLSKEFDTYGFGVDVSRLTIQYAAANATADGRNSFCVADGTRLGWIAENHFDFGFSFGSIYHVYNTTKFCGVLREMVRILKPGGRFYNGWTENSEFNRKDIERCVNAGGLDVDDEEGKAAAKSHHKIQIIEEKDAFQGIKTFPLKQYRKTPNTYSLIITKEGGSGQGEAQEHREDKDKEEEKA